MFPYEIIMTVLQIVSVVLTAIELGLNGNKK
jgi:hypothetical protein